MPDNFAGLLISCNVIYQGWLIFARLLMEICASSTESAGDTLKMDLTHTNKLYQTVEMELIAIPQTETCVKVLL